MNVLGIGLVLVGLFGLGFCCGTLRCLLMFERRMADLERED